VARTQTAVLALSGHQFDRHDDAVAEHRQRETGLEAIMLAGAQQALPWLRGADRLSAQPVLRTVYRYGLSVTGPVAVSAAHFIASLIFLRLLQAGEFGQFSFLLIIVPFCLSAAGALLGAPAALTRGKDETTAGAEISTLQKTSLVITGVAGIAVAALMYSTHAGAAQAILFGLYGAGATLRAFARSLANVHARLLRVAGSDLVYAGVLVAGLTGLIAFNRLTMSNAAFVLVLSTGVSFLPYGWRHWRDLIRSTGAQPLTRYLPMWRDVTRWSLLGVVLTELTINAYAYFVTFLSGPKAFGLLALGALLMRPASLVLSALPDIDQPLMTRRLAHGDVRGAFRVVNEFRTAAAAVLAGTILLSVVLVNWFPQLFLKKGYDESDVLIVLALWIAITAVRVWRTPDAVFLQATGNYSALARVSGWSSATSLVATFVLLCVAGPVASLGGVLAGEIAIVLALFPLTRAWRRQHA
jgi:O-antigen/teichoic acid export membrane protein